MALQFTLRQLEYVVAVAHHLNFGEAARACHVSQPALSTQVSQLEGTLGEKLFERGSRGIVVTPFGAEIVPLAREVLDRAHRLRESAEARRDPLTGELRLGVIPTVAPFVLPPLMARLRAEYPQARIFLREGRTADLVERVLDGELDLALLALEADLGPLETRAVFEDPFLAALPEGHPMAGTDTVRLSELPADELLLLDEGHCLSRQVMDVCSLSNETTSGNFRASSLVTLVEMVANGIGITLLPEIAVRSEIVRNAGVEMRPLAERPYRTIGLAFRPGCPRCAEFEKLAELIG